MPHHYTDPKPKMNLSGPAQTFAGDSPAEIMEGLSFLQVPIGSSPSDVLRGNVEGSLDQFEITQLFNQVDPEGRATGVSGFAYRPLEIVEALETSTPPGSNIGDVPFQGAKEIKSRSRGNTNRVGLRNGRNISRRKLANRAFRNRN